MNADVEAMLARRHDQGADYWSTPDGRLYKGSPFSTLTSLLVLHELGVPAGHEAVRGGIALILDACRDDGRIRLAPGAPLYPCYTAEAARVLCRYGLERDEPVLRTVGYLLGSVHETGGWRCSFTRFGRGPETELANPGATLFALDVLRFHEELREGRDDVDRSVESLLDHWEVRSPVGPCHYGIGTLFMQVEFPFLRYNLFHWVYVLSFFGRAREDRRFQEALEVLGEKRTAEGEMVVERPHRRLKDLDLCAEGRPSVQATARYGEIEENVGT